MHEVEQEFEAKVRDLLSRTLKETSYRPTYFMQMLDERGAYDTALTLVRTSKPSEGFTRLWELKRLDLTIETLVVDPAFQALFIEDDVRKARRRLEAYGYL